MNLTHRLTNWLESHWITPAYSGWLLGSLSIFFFIAATNTLAGWLYVLSGIGLALLAIAAVLPERALRKIRVQRRPIAPVTVGDRLIVELVLENLSNQPKTLLQIQDWLPDGLGQSVTGAIEVIPVQQPFRWIYEQPTERRGVYRWQQVDLRTAAPLGLFWCRRSHTIKAIAIVYPTVLALARCPLIDQLGRDLSLQFNSDRRTQAATEGITRSLRPYRWGDPTRLIHWRTSARYGELRVRELETLTGGQELVIALDNASWHHRALSQPSETFEQIVIAAASLYFYAAHRQLNVKLWTAATGLVQGRQAVLETLAAVQAGADRQAELPATTIVWLTQNPLTLNSLPAGSRWLLWTAAGKEPSEPRSQLSDRPGMVIDTQIPLQAQLQRTLTMNN